MAFIPYGDHWRARRRVFWQEFHHSNKSADHQAAQLRNAKNFLKRLLSDPDNLFHHARYTTAATILEITYGMAVQFSDDPTVARSDHALHHLNAAGTVGTYLVDYLPLLRHVPRWIPGAGFRKLADQSREDVDKMWGVPYAESRRAIDEGRGLPSLMTRSLALLNEPGSGEDVERLIKDVAAIAYVGGADTAPPALTTFVAAMVLYPDVQKEPQEELDAVVGLRLPTFEDFPSLPYIQALMWETLRWKPVLPLGQVHMLTIDDVYKGYYLPAGSSIFCNVWEIMQDKQLFPDPTSFNPNRFLKSGKINRELTDIVELGFGFGRRICPGRFLAINTLLIWISFTLTVFHITKAKDEQGNDIIPETEVLPGQVTICPGRFLAINTLLIWISFTLTVFNITQAKDEQGNDIIPETEVLPGQVTDVCTL